MMEHTYPNRYTALHILALSALALSATTSANALRHGAHQLRDLYAYPKYEVQFLNDLPLSKSDAERFTSAGVGDIGDWLRARSGDRSTGLGTGASGSGSSEEGGGSRKSLGDGSGSGSETGSALSAGENNLELVPMNFAHPDEPHGAPYPYLCLMPSRNATSSQLRLLDQMEDEFVEDHNNGSELDPSQGWAALGHLEGKCLYSKQGWFTYAYCHNSHIRQFRQAPHKHPHPPEGIVPTEDREYDAYTLGQVSPDARQRFATGAGGVRTNHLAKQASSPNKAEQANLPRANVGNGYADSLGDGGRKTSLSTSPGNGNGNGQGQVSPTVSFGHGASSRYLVQRWSHGTRCDKTGRPREVEVQIHCSMTTGDMIYMIKELSICQYVVIIHSPYLCGLPGFKSRDLGAIQSAGIQCRQVVEDDEFDEWEKEKEQEQKHKQSALELDQSQKSNTNAEGDKDKDTDKSASSFLGLPFGKRPTGADNTLAALLSGDHSLQQQQQQQQQREQQHFGIKGPENMFGSELIKKEAQHGIEAHEEAGAGADGGITFDEVEILFSGKEVDDAALREMLKKALNSLSDRDRAKDRASPAAGGGEGEGKGAEAEADADAGEDGDSENEKVIFYSWEEDDDGTPILVDTDTDVEADIVIVDEEGNEIPQSDAVEGNANVKLKEKGKDKEKDMLLHKAIRDFLGQKGKKKSTKLKGQDGHRGTVESEEKGNAGDKEEL
ncbi:hypothetical protein IAU59_005291 [Kwoniella sp. CBS 9459]